MNNAGLRRLAQTVLASAFSDLMTDDVLEIHKQQLADEPNKCKRQALREAIYRDSAARKWFEAHDYLPWTVVLEIQDSEVYGKYAKIVKEGLPG